MTLFNLKITKNFSLVKVVLTRSTRKQSFLFVCCLFVLSGGCGWVASAGLSTKRRGSGLIPTTWTACQSVLEEDREFAWTCAHLWEQMGICISVDCEVLWLPAGRKELHKYNTSYCLWTPKSLFSSQKYTLVYMYYSAEMSPRKQA